MEEKAKYLSEAVALDHARGSIPQADVLSGGARVWA